MTDAADQAVAQEERLNAFAESYRRRLAALMPAPPVAPRNCVDCAEPIPELRLRAYPYATRCITCATDVERWRAHGGRL